MRDHGRIDVDAKQIAAIEAGQEVRLDAPSGLTLHDVAARVSSLPDGRLELALIVRDRGAGGRESRHEARGLDDLLDRAWPASGLRACGWEDDLEIEILASSRALRLPAGERVLRLSPDWRVRLVPPKEGDGMLCLEPRAQLSVASATLTRGAPSGKYRLQDENDPDAPIFTVDILPDLPPHAPRRSPAAGAGARWL